MLALCLALSACAGEAGGERTDSVKNESAADGGEDSGAAAGGAGQEDQASENAEQKESEGPVEVGDDYRDFTAILTEGASVNAGELEESVQRFLEKNGYEFPVALDTEGEICNLYPSDGIPYTVLIGKDGTIASIHLGADTAVAM